MENELDAISEHKTDKETVLREFYGPFEKALKVADENIPVVEQPVIVSDVKCEKCGRFMVVKEGRHGKFLVCTWFLECREHQTHLGKGGGEVPPVRRRPDRTAQQDGTPVLRLFQLPHLPVHVLGQALQKPAPSAAA